MQSQPLLTSPIQTAHRRRSRRNRRTARHARLQLKNSGRGRSQCRRRSRRQRAQFGSGYQKLPLQPPKPLPSTLSGKKPNRSTRTLERARANATRGRGRATRKRRASRARRAESPSQHDDAAARNGSPRHRPGRGRTRCASSTTGRPARDSGRRRSWSRRSQQSQTTDGEDTGAPRTSSSQDAEHGEPVDPAPPTAMARLNYFRAEDIAVMRKRRQMFALCLLGVVVVLWLLGRMGYLQMPENLGKDSLAQLPLSASSCPTSSPAGFCTASSGSAARASNGSSRVIPSAGDARDSILPAIGSGSPVASS